MAELEKGYVLRGKDWVSEYSCQGRFVSLKSERNVSRIVIKLRDVDKGLPEDMIGFARFLRIS
jgi:hypothetical protein